MLARPERAPGLRRLPAEPPADALVPRRARPGARRRCSGTSTSARSRAPRSSPRPTRSSCRRSPSPPASRSRTPRCSPSSGGARSGSTPSPRSTATCSPGAAVDDVLDDIAVTRCADRAWPTTSGSCSPTSDRRARGSSPPTAIHAERVVGTRGADRRHRGRRRLPHRRDPHGRRRRRTIRGCSSPRSRPCARAGRLRAARGGGRDPRRAVGRQREGRAGLRRARHRGDDELRPPGGAGDRARPEPREPATGSGCSRTGSASVATCTTPSSSGCSRSACCSRRRSWPTPERPARPDRAVDRRGRRDDQGDPHEHLPAVDTTASRDCGTRSSTMVDGYADRSGFEAHVVFDGPVDTAIPAAVAQHVVAVLREGVSNAVRHAERRARLRARRRPASDRARTHQRRRGRHSRAETPRSGLANLARRADELGGSFDIASTPGGGTTLTWRVPLDGAGMSDDDADPGVPARRPRGRPRAACGRCSRRRRHRGRRRGRHRRGGAGPDPADRARRRDPRRPAPRRLRRRGVPRRSGPSTRRCSASCSRRSPTTRRCSTRSSPAPAGYLLKQVRGTDIVDAVRRVAGGQSLLDPDAHAACPRADARATRRGRAARAAHRPGAQDPRPHRRGSHQPPDRRAGCSWPRRRSRTTCRTCCRSSAWSAGPRRRCSVPRSSQEDRHAAGLTVPVRRSGSFGPSRRPRRRSPCAWVPTGRHAPELSRAECLELLRPGRFGRIGVSIDALPAIFPVFITVVDDVVVFRTVPGHEAARRRRGAIVALEVDRSTIDR